MQKYGDETLFAWDADTNVHKADECSMFARGPSAFVSARNLVAVSFPKQAGFREQMIMRARGLKFEVPIHPPETGRSVTNSYDVSLRWIDLAAYDKVSRALVRVLVKAGGFDTASRSGLTLRMVQNGTPHSVWSGYGSAVDALYEDFESECKIVYIR